MSAKTLFGVFHGREQKRYVMGVTSVWLLVPILLGSCSQPPTSTPNLALRAWTGLACIVSTATYPTLGTPAARWVYPLDKACAPVMFVFLCVFFACKLEAHTLPAPASVGLPFAVALFFAGSRFFELVVLHDAAATLCHLTFRFIGFWWVFAALTPARLGPLGFGCTFFVNSALYWTHAVYSVRATGRVKEFRVRDRYARGCVEVACMAVVSARASLAFAR